jgi:O-antigen/teichoic acid export membrane protein
MTVAPAVIPDNTSEVVEEALETTEIKRLAAGGAVLVVARGAALQVLSFAANIVLARLLVPRDFGLVALGNTIVVFGDLMANSGASTTLIRSETTPQLADLRAIMGFQLALTSAITVCVLAISLPLGQAGGLSAVMSLALPLLALRSAPAVMLERSLAYRKLVMVEITENLVYFSWAIGTVLAGLGVWGLATGVVVRIIAGTVVLNSIGPVGWLRPMWSWSRLRPVIGFGARVQMTSALNFVRDQMMNVALAAEASVATLGLWTLAVRAIAIPMLLFEALWRVAFPAITRLMALGEDTRAIVENSIGMVATAGTAPLAALAACGPALIPAIFGSGWAGAADALPPACIGLMIVGPVSVACSGFLGAHGDAGTMLRGAVLHTAAQFAIALPLLPILGLWGVGLGLLGACVVEAIVLGRRAAEVTRARVVASMAGPVIAGVLGTGAGWLFAYSGPPTALVGLAAATIAIAVYALVLILTPGNKLLPTARSMRLALSAAR